MISKILGGGLRYLPFLIQNHEINKIKNQIEFNDKIHWRIIIRWKIWKALKMDDKKLHAYLLTNYIFARTLVSGLIWFYGISTFAGYLMPNPFLYK